MTTITEILAEAFNRVKAEHGVTLSRVEYEHYSGSLSGVNFSADGVVNMGYPPSGMPQVPYNGPLPPGPIPLLQPHQMPPPPITQHVDPITQHVDPIDATHIGSVDIYDDCYWKFEGGRLYVWDGVERWMLYDAGESAQRTVDCMLRTVSYPASQSASGSDS